MSGHQFVRQRAESGEHGFEKTERGDSLISRTICTLDLGSLTINFHRWRLPIFLHIHFLILQQMYRFPLTNLHLLRILIRCNHLQLESLLVILLSFNCEKWLKLPYLAKSYSQHGT